MHQDAKALEVLKQAYMLVLQMPHGGVRARQQAVFCALRDAIVEETGIEAQEVQDSFECMALQMRLAA